MEKNEASIPAENLAKKVLEEIQAELSDVKKELENANKKEPEKDKDEALEQAHEKVSALRRKIDRARQEHETIKADLATIETQLPTPEQSTNKPTTPTNPPKPEEPKAHEGPVYPYPEAKTFSEHASNAFALMNYYFSMGIEKIKEMLSHAPALAGVASNMVAGWIGSFVPGVGPMLSTTINNLLQGSPLATAIKDLALVKEITIKSSQNDKEELSKLLTLFKTFERVQRGDAHTFIEAVIDQAKATEVGTAEFSIEKLVAAAKIVTSKKPVQQPVSPAIPPSPPPAPAAPSSPAPAPAPVPQPA